LSEKATSVAVTGVPSENTASSRSVNVYSVASSLTSQLVARLGLGSVTSLFSNVSRVSYIAGMMIPPVVSNIRPGSSVARSKLLPITNVPPPPPPPPLVAGARLAAGPDAAPVRAGPTASTPTAASATAKARRVLLPALIHLPLVGARGATHRANVRAEDCQTVATGATDEVR
jgi:hypothetical protein